MIEKLDLRPQQSEHDVVPAIQGKINEIIGHLNGEKNTPKQETWTVEIRRGQTIEGTLKECEKLFEVWRYTDADLDELLTSDRDSTEAYEVSFRANVEADEQLKSKSADDLQKEGVKGITLLERLQLEVDHFKSTGKHLDIESWTLCSGSRRSGGDVPGVHWHSYDSAVDIRWYYPDSRDASLRSREVVSLVPYNKTCTLALA